MNLENFIQDLLVDFIASLSKKDAKLLLDWEKQEYVVANYVKKVVGDRSDDGMIYRFIKSILSSFINSIHYRDRDKIKKPKKAVKMIINYIESI